MNNIHHNRTMLLMALAACAVGSQAQMRGPSSSQDPYILPAATGVQTVSIITVGDFVNLKPDGSPYYLVGIPDGMGAWAGGKGAFNLLVNHELRGHQGIVRRHGEIGAFVSQWNIDSKTFRVGEGHDLIHTVNLVNGDAVLRRLCSADLAAQSAFYFPKGQVGTETRLFLNGEEDDDGRAFAHIVDGSLSGNSYELPLFGKQAWENVVACPTPQERTLVIAIDDTTPGQVFAYIGTKQADGLPHERAGLTNGSQYGIRVPNVAEESRETGLNGETRFELAPLGDVSGLSEEQLNAECDIAGVTRFLRPEDGAWDSSAPKDFYFVTTDRFDNNEQEGRSRLYRLRFDDLSDPAAGGDIAMLLDGTEGQQMMDNMTIDKFGNILIQEDPGNQEYIAKVWNYSIADDELVVIAQHNPFFFFGENALTQDEESSGIIDARDLIGPGWFLLNTQAHYTVQHFSARGYAELVQGGQLMALYNPASDR